MQEPMADRSSVTRILIVDDHPIVRQGLVMFITQEPDLQICGEAENIQQALEAVAILRPDLAIIDLSLHGDSGFDLVKTLKTEYPEILTLVVSMHDESLYAERVLRLGARGYITKQEAPDMILRAIRRVLQGEIYLSEKMHTRILERAIGGAANPDTTPRTQLSKREFEVFHLIGRGYSTRHIAEVLYVSTKTVEAHRARIITKLGLKNSADLLLYAVQWFHKTALELTEDFAH